MNAEALIGKVLGTCTLQKIVGQGGMGAVYLAQQSRPRRPVAVKVLLPSTALTARQQAAFLERFRRETDAAASLEHPNILPVHEYGERDGLAYLVVPYIGGGTIRDVIEQEGQLPLPKVLNYLEQLASALDFAHERGVIHRDIKPANILITSEGRLLLTDFGLVKIIADGQAPQVRLTGAGAPVGTPDYMAPEQVIGEVVDGRSDLYSLGIILYQMITGLTPFQGETPMQIAAQQLQTPPPSPRILRKDLPLAVEQVLLRSIAKRPADRYATCSEFAEAFRNALIFAGIPLGNTASSIPAIGATDSGSATSDRLFTPRGLFDPTWQTGAMPVPLQGKQADGLNTSMPTGVFPAMNNEGSRSSGLLSRTGMFPRPTSTGQLPTATTNTPSSLKATGVLPTTTGAQAAAVPFTSGKLPTATAATNIQPGVMPASLQQESPALRTTTGAIKVPGTDQNTGNTMKLTGPVKVVQVPVADQPGRYVTGLLPVVPQTPAEETQATPKKGHFAAIWQKIVLAVLVLFVIAAAGGSFWYLRGRTGQVNPRTDKTVTTTSGRPNLSATATAQVQATADANIILSDPLVQNIHNFPISKNEFFTGGAYHISNTDGNAVAVVLAEQPLTIPNAYTITMMEVKGNDTSNNNSFGMIIRFSQQKNGGKTVTTFYSFEVVNTSGGEYRFYKYDDSQGSPSKDWMQLWHTPFGREYHQGQGQRGTNTFRIYQNGANFIFTVNGKVVGNTRDGSLKSGTVGMLVNLKGTEVAFSNMQITRN
jgi:serine/threonine protein kinase